MSPVCVPNTYGEYKTASRNERTPYAVKPQRGIRFEYLQKFETFFSDSKYLPLRPLRVNKTPLYKEGSRCINIYIYVTGVTVNIWNLRKMFQIFGGTQIGYLSAVSLHRVSVHSGTRSCTLRTRPGLDGKFSPGMNGHPMQ